MSTTKAGPLLISTTPIKYCWLPFIYDGHIYYGKTVIVHYTEIARW